MIREGQPLGAITVARRVVRPFTDGQIALLQTFADQAVIAIENVRLFKELEVRNRDLSEALEQQTATSEILRVISSSPTDVQPVFDAIVASAMRLCGGRHGTLYRRHGDMVDCVAQHNVTLEIQDLLRRAFPRPVTTGASPHFHRALLEGTVESIPDIETDPDLPRRVREVYRSHDMRSVVMVPLLGQREVLGVLVVGHGHVAAFSDSHMALLKTFADQAVIAIENVRLFTELEARNGELRTALDQQTATSDLLKVIGRSNFDLQPVFDTLAENGVRLCEAERAFIFRFDGQLLRAVASHNASAELRAFVEQNPIAPGRHTGTARAALERRTIHIHDVLADPEYTYGAPQVADIRTVLGIPILRASELLGVFMLFRDEVRPFDHSQVALMETFADQAAIAIENARLLNELQAKNSELTEALEQQTATSEILRAISQSPTDVQPVFDIIGERAERLCAADVSVVSRFDGELIQLVALHGVAQEGVETVRRAFPMRPDDETVTARAFRNCTVIHIPDVLADPLYQQKGAARAGGYRGCLGVPMVREGQVTGVIFVARATPGYFADTQVELLKTFADQAVIAVENVRLFKELDARNHDLTEALEQQTATSEILRVMSSSPTDVRPVFDTIAKSAVKLCDGMHSAVTRLEGGLIHLVASHNWSLEGMAVSERLFPMPPEQDHLTAHAIRDNRIIHIHRMHDDLAVPATSRELAIAQGYQTLLIVPILREARAVGAIIVAKAQGPFSESQVELLKTFAEQALIAIENVRLFKELEARNLDLTEALEQQTATAEILRVISTSPTDIQPVLDTVVKSAARFCGADDAEIYLSGERLTVSAHYGPIPSPVGRGIEIVRGSVAGRAVLDRRAVHVDDLQAETEEFPVGSAMAREFGYRSALVVPLLREGTAVGTINLRRTEVRPFTDKQTALLQTFADQAVIAIENVRLFKELEVRNRDLTVALEQQTATSEILRVISRSQTDVQPVFDTIVTSAVTLCDGLFSALFQFDGELINQVAQHNFTPEALEQARRLYPTRPSRAHGSGRTILDRAVVHIPDVELDPEYQHQALPRAIGMRSGLFVPMLREGAPIGVIMVARAAPGPFSDNEIDLLKTFADQAVIAVENVRLFKELQARTGELTQSVEKLTALGEISQALSSTLDVETVLDTIVSHASQLAGGAGSAIFEYDEAAEQFELRATHNYEAGFVEALRAAPLRKGEGLMGRAAEMREPIQVPDISQPGAYQSSLRDTLIRFGYRALLSVPLLREEQIIGNLSLTRKAPGEYSTEVIEVLKTFATQSALAIQNARLFREIADKSRQLEVASRHKSEFMANMSHELRTPLNAIIGFSEVLNERMFGELNEKQDEYLRDIHASGQHLLSLINDILDLSKVEAGRMELELTDFDLPAAIDNAVTLVRERASRKGITARIAVGELVGMIQGDERKIRQVLLNLLSNAIKFTPEGGRIEVGALMDEGAVEVSVRDTGVGIAPEDHEAVFEEFRQVGASAAKQEGTGLGLALCRKFIELHGGTIRVESAIGAGSTFTFRLPTA
jgi:GAF domain-containing protein